MTNRQVMKAEVERILSKQYDDDEAAHWIVELFGLNAEQKSPTRSTDAEIWPLVIADMQERDQIGRKKYGTPLKANNGRDALTDAYQECLDLAVYLRQAIEERRANATAKSKDSP